MALREILARFDVQVGGLSKLNQADKSITGLVGKLQGVAAAFAGSAIIGGVKNFISGIVNAGDEIATAADRLDLSTQALQEWRFVAINADVTNEELSGAFKFLTKNMYEAQKASSEQAKSFDALGVQVKDADGKLRSADTVLSDVLTALGGTENATERAALAMKVFGKGGQALIPLAKMSAEQVAKLKDEFKALGGGLDETAIKMAGDADNALHRYDLAMMGLKGRIAHDVLPKFTEFVDSASKLIAKISKATEGTNLFSAGLVTAGAVAASMLGSMLLPLAPVIAKWLLLWLVIDDLITTMQGGESVTQGLIDSLFGVGATHDAVWRVKDVLREIGEGDYRGAVDSLYEGLGNLGERIVQTGSALDDFTTSGERGADGLHRIKINWDDFHTSLEQGRSPLQKLGDGVRDTFLTFHGIIGEIIELFIRADFAITQTVGGWGASVGKALQPMYDALKSIPTKIGEFISSTTDNLAKGKIEFATQAEELGTAITDGLVKAIKEGAKAVWDALTGTVQEAFDGAKKIINPGSPSKTAYRLMSTVPAGFTQALEQGGRGPQLAMSRLVGRTMSPAMALGNISVHQSNQINVQGAGNPYVAANLVAQKRTRLTTSAIDDAYEALVPSVA